MARVGSDDFVYKLPGQPMAFSVLRLCLERTSSKLQRAPALEISFTWKVESK
jgi:hypothetical protein